MNPQQAEAVLFEAAGIVEDSDQEQPEAGEELDVTEEVTQPEDETTEESAEESPESEDADNEDAEDDDAEESEESEGVEFELDGEKFTANRIRDLRDKAKNLEAASTKKWQAMAEKSKALESKLDENIQTAELFAAQLKAPLARFEQLDWNALKTQQPEQYNAYKAQYQQAQAGFDQLQAHLEQKRTEKAQLAEENRKARISSAVETLKDRHSDWSNELYHKAIQHAVEHLGFAEADAREELNPAVISLWVNDLRRAEVVNAVKPSKPPVKRTIKAKASKPVDPKAQQEAAEKQLRSKARNGDMNAARAIEMAELKRLGII